MLLSQAGQFGEIRPLIGHSEGERLTEVKMIREEQRNKSRIPEATKERVGPTESDE